MRSASRLLFLLAILSTAVLLPKPSYAQRDSEDSYHGADSQDELSERDIDRILLEDSDNGLEDARKTLKNLDRELESALPRNIEKRSSDKMARNMSRRLRRPEVVNWNAPEPKKRKKKKKD